MVQVQESFPTLFVGTDPEKGPFYKGLRAFAKLHASSAAATRNA